MQKELEQNIYQIVLKKYPEVKLLLLFGSRARQDANANSDWDFGYVASSDFESAAFYTDLVLLLKTEKVDLVDLSRANGLLRFRAVRDGRLIFEKQPGQYHRFWLEVVHFWCDAGPLIRAEYDSMLERLG